MSDVQFNALDLNLLRVLDACSKSAARPGPASGSG